MLYGHCFSPLIWFVSLRTFNQEELKFNGRNQLILYADDSNWLGESICTIKKRKLISFIFNDKSTGSCTYLRLDLYLSHVKKHDTIITCATAVCFCFYLCSPSPPTIRSHTCAYVKRMKHNFSRSFEPRHVIPDTRISSGQCPRCDVNVTLGSRDFQGHTK
jgi:hypothetical protein